MGYSIDSSKVRVDFFKESGKWYTTIELEWDRWSMKLPDGSTELVDETFERCLDEQLEGRFKGMIAVCLEPYHENAFPLMVRR